MEDIEFVHKLRELPLSALAQTSGRSYPKTGLPRYRRQARASLLGGFKRLAVEPVEVTVSAGSIVKHFEIVKDIGTRKISGYVNPSLAAFLFRTVEERLGNRIVPTVPTPTHARFQSVGTAESDPVIAAVM